jgi:3-oxoadipate enol-lactonase
MPKLRVNGVELNYIDVGTGDETIVFSHGLLMSLHMFDAQIAHYQSRFRVIAYDHRGQGESEVTASGYDYDMDTIAEDAAALIESLELGAVHFVGLSMGGFTGMRLGARRPELIKSLVLMETSADPEPPENVPRYNLLRFVARWLSPKLVASGATKSLFGATFLNDPARKGELTKWRQHIGNSRRVGMAEAAKGVFSRQPIYDEIAAITAPTLVIVGEEDVATVPAKAERIHQQIAGSKLVHIPKAGHSSSIEQPQAIIEAMDAFYATIR